MITQEKLFQKNQRILWCVSLKMASNESKYKSYQEIIVYENTEPPLQENMKK